jgi:hypothetical protein
MMEFLTFREAAKIERVVLGTSSGLPNRKLGKCARPADDTSSISDLMEYLFAPLSGGDGNSSALAQLRAADGHPAPFSSDGLIIEIGNECHCDPSYFPSFNETISVMVGRVRATAPQVGRLSFASMAGVIMERDCSAAENIALARIVSFWADHQVQVLSDQHIPAEVGPSGFSQVFQTMANMTAMVRDMRGPAKNASGFAFFVGEENCASDKRTPNDALCHGLGRALLHALNGNGLHRLGSETCLGAASATLYGASGRQFEWPQAGIEFTSSRVLLQPPFWVKQMVGESYRGAVVHSTPSSYNTSQCAVSTRVDPNSTTDGCDIVDLLVLKPSASSASKTGLVLRVVSSLLTSINVSLTLTAKDATTTTPCSELSSLLGGGSTGMGGWSCEVLACDANVSASNTLGNPSACVPRPWQGARWTTRGNASTVSAQGGSTCVATEATVELSLPPYSFMVCTQQESATTWTSKSDDVDVIPTWAGPMPDKGKPRAGLPPSPNTTFSVLARAANATGMYTDGPSLEESHGTIVATWFKCPRVSEKSCVCGERSLFSYSLDGGDRWSRAAPLFDAVACLHHEGTRIYPFVFAKISCGVGCARLYGVAGVDPVTPHAGPTPNSAFSAFDTAPKVMRRIEIDTAGRLTLGPIFWAEAYANVSNRLGFHTLVQMSPTTQADVSKYISGAVGFAPNYGGLKFGPAFQFITPAPASKFQAALDERSAYQRRVGGQRQLVLLMRNDGRHKDHRGRLFASLRNLTAAGRLDTASRWTAPVPTSLPDAPSRTWAGVLSPSTLVAYLLGTQVANDSSRDPLTLSLAPDGTHFTKAFAVFTATDVVPLGIDTAGQGFSYPGGLVFNGTLFVAVAACKESIVLARMPVAALSMQ